jgi:hypothetical protein
MAENAEDAEGRRRGGRDEVAKLTGMVNIAVFAAF